MGIIILAAIVFIVTVVVGLTDSKGGNGVSARSKGSGGSRFGGGSSARHSHQCDGNCDSCPDHYGYRYGRWYYGRGHQHGCQRGGNGGAAGKTYRD